MKNMTIRTLLFTVGIVISIGLIPHTASAKSGIRIDLPGISIGLNDRYSDRYNNNRYRNNNYQNRNNSYQNRSNNYQRYYSPTYRSTIKRTYRNNNQYYYQPSQRIYTPSYQSEICPEPGYSPNYYDGHGCTQHLDHYHCD